MCGRPRAPLLREGCPFHTEQKPGLGGHLSVSIPPPAAARISCPGSPPSLTFLSTSLCPVGQGDGVIQWRLASRARWINVYFRSLGRVETGFG